jgi:amino acid adenylation domain-containing protein
LKFLDEDRLRGFDLTQAPLMRLTLIQVADASAILVWSFHHLILDRWSVDLVQQEVWSAYQTLVKGQPPQFNALRPYREYIGWLQDQDLNRAEKYWRQLLSGFTAPTVLGVDQAPPTRAGHQEGSYNSEKVTLPEAAASALSRWARQQQLTVNTVVQGAWALLLSRYSGSEDVVFGTTVSGRSAGLPGIESMVGLFINTLPVRVELSPGLCMVPWLMELQEQQVTLREYEYTPLYEIQKWSEVPPGEPLFNTLLVFENTPAEIGGNLMAGTAGLNVQRVAGSRGGETNYPLTVVVIPGRKLQVQFTYDTEHYTAEAITRMVGHFQQVLTAMIGDREQTLLGAIPLLTEAEHQLMLVEWNATETTYPREDCIHDLFEAQVQQTPDAVALVYGEDTLTYDELNTRANQLAHYLISLGVGPETLVGLYMERSLEMVVGIYGILKAGGAYVPLDPEYPSDRVAYMIEDTEVPVLLTQARLSENLPQHRAKVICLDAEWSTVAREKTINPELDVVADDIAYVIYTSGSTGKPKGVMNEHRGICNRILWMQDEYGLTDSDRVLQKTPFSFDVSVWEFFWPLLVGARLIIARPEGHRDSAYLVKLIVEQGITTLHFVPSMLQIFLEEKGVENCRSLKRIICSGEVLPYDLQNRFFERLDVELHNLYGPTEAAVDVSFWPCQRDSELPVVPIGFPVANTQLCILDAGMQPVPIGVSGELHIGGVQVARGYLNRPNLTAEKFISDPFSPKPGSRLYKTGDLARYLSNGGIEYIGRTDFQVKIRGLRIELREIEMVLSQHPGVRETVVMAREDRPEGKRLAAYVVASHEPTPTFNELHSFLKEKLPDYMIPSAFVFLDLLPLAPSGKIDRRALPVPDLERSRLETAFVAPRTPVEKILAKIWCEVLGLERVGVYDNFLELGGHSLLATQVVSRISETFETDLSLRSLFENQTIADLAKVIENIIITEIDTLLEEDVEKQLIGEEKTGVRK